MTNSSRNIKWVAAYLLGAILGLFAGANLLAIIFEDQVHDSEGFMALLYGSMLGLILTLTIVTLVRVFLARKSIRKI